MVRHGDAAGRQPKEPPTYADGLGVHVHTDRYEGRLVRATATVLSLGRLVEETAKNKASMPNDMGALYEVLSAEGVIVGVIEVGEIEYEERGPCLGSWQVSRVAGPRYAELLYGLGFALSPKGLLTSDRNEVALGAEKVWARQHAMGRTRRQLAPMSAKSNASCFGYEDALDLNYVYEAEGWERALLRRLELRTSLPLSRLKTSLSVSKRDLFDVIAETSWFFWQEHIEGTRRNSRFRVSRREW